MYPSGAGGAQWGQPGQYQPPKGPGYMQTQPTGLQPQQPQQLQQQQPMGVQTTGYPIGPQSTGMFGASIGPQPPGMMGGGGGLRPPMIMGGHSRPQRFLGPQATGMPTMGMMPTGRYPMQAQPTGFPGQQTSAFIGAQHTGFMGAQPTGMPLDPRMQLMSAQFLPSSTPFSGAPVASNMSFSNASIQPSSFQSQIQNLSQQQQGSREPRIPWTLSKEEKKSYDVIFRAWDQQGTGFISGDVAREVFGQSGLSRDGLMQIWHLSDTENRGKLNLAEFHVAMGLIYRALNGNDIPLELPPELIPPSSKQLSESVDFMRDLLKRDTSVRTSTGLNLPEAGSNRDTHYQKSRSLYQNPVERRQDATAYKHEESGETGGYRSSSRHLDRKAVRWGGESKDDDLSEMKRQLANTQKMLQDQDVDDDDFDDREIAKEMEDLRFRIRRVQDDIEYYNRRGGRDVADQRRKAERELMHLTHERLPQLERRMEDNERRKRDRKRGESKQRDRRNELSMRSSALYPSSRHYEDDSDKRSMSDTKGQYLRSSFDREDSWDTARYHERSSEDLRREDDRGLTSRTLSPDRTEEPKPAVAISPSPSPSPAPVPAPAPAPAPLAASTFAPAGPSKNMTPQERQAWIRSEAQRRIQERMRALGASAPSMPGLDPSVEDRIRADREEAEMKSALADQEAAAREEARRARLEEQKLSKDKAAVSAVKSELNSETMGPDALPSAVTEEARRQVNKEEDMIRRRQEVLAKEKAEREMRFKKLEEEEAEARRHEEAFRENQSMFANKAQPPSTASAAWPAPSRKKDGPPPPPTRNRGPASSASSAVIAPTPPAPSAPQPADSTVTSPTASTNPFYRMQADKAGNGTPSSQSATNPFFRQQQQQTNTESPAPAPLSADSSLPPPSRPTTANVVNTPTGAATRSASMASAPSKPSDDDWEESDKSDYEDEDDDGPGTTTRAARQNLAQALFSGIVPSGGSGSGHSTPSAAAPAPAAPPAPPVDVGAPPPPLAPPSGGSGSGHSTPSAAAPAPAAPPAPPVDVGAPPPPLAPPSDSAPAPPAAPFSPAFRPPSGPVDRGALLSQIQGGARLKKAVTRDASGPPGAGKVLGDANAPVQKYMPPPSPPSPPVQATAEADKQASSFIAGNANRQSVDWATSLAADHMNGPKASAIPDEPLVREEEESHVHEAGPEDPDRPSLALREAAEEATNGHAQVYLGAAIAEDVISELQEDFDLGITIRVRTLFPYGGQREEDLSFNENEIILAHPGKDAASDWMYGTLLTAASGKKGQFPRAYVAEMNNAATARALYDYTGGSADEATFAEGDELQVVDQEDASWWKVEQDDAIKIVPATYIELSAACTDFAAPREEADLRRSSAAQIRRIDDVLAPDDASSKHIKPANVDGEEEDEVRLSDSTTGWTSSEEEKYEEERKEGKDTEASVEIFSPEAEAARAAERLKVLQAAGLLVKSEQGDAIGVPPTGARSAQDLLLRRKMTRRHGAVKGPRPEAPARKRPSAAAGDGKRVPKPWRDLPPRPVASPPSRPAVAVAPPELGKQMEDAYDRFMKLQNEMRNPKVENLSADSLIRLEERPSSSGSSGSVQVTPGIGSPHAPSRPATATGNEVASSSASSMLASSSTGKTSGFLSTLTSSLRSKTHSSATAERRPTPIISGPIGGPAMNTDVRPQSDLGPSSSAELMSAPALTTSTWSSFIDEGTLQTLPDKERRRQEAIFELCQTESTHVRDLQTIVEVFFNGIQEQGLLDEKARMVIFANVEDVLLTSVSFLSDLEERQRASRLYVDHIGDLLITHLPQMKAYLPYCTNQATAAQILSTERSRNPRLNSLLQQLRSSPQGRGLDLSSYLLTPMQRITRYPLLLKQIYKYTEEDHADYEVLRQSTHMADAILSETNERIREEEGRERLKMLSQTLFVGTETRVDLTKPTRHLGPRKILKEEVLSKRKSKSGRKLGLVLCNDILLILAGPNLYRMPAPLEEVVVRERKSRAVGIGGAASGEGTFLSGGVGGSGEEGTFQILLGGTDKVDLKTSSVRAAHMWMRAIEEARSECLAKAIKVPSFPPATIRGSDGLAGSRFSSRSRPSTLRDPLSAAPGSGHSWQHQRHRSSMSQQLPMSPSRSVFLPS